MSVTTPSILIADDEPVNVEIIAEFLESEGYDLHFAEDGATAWAMLEATPELFDVVLLDRMMPGMNGMEVLARIKADPRLESMPVILQTARAAHEDVAEGIQAGAFYYLIKPFAEEVLCSIVKTAVTDSRRFRRLREELSKTNRTLALLSSGRFRFRTLEESRALAALIAQACPDANRVITGLAELMVNAVEHGNLGIRYDDKTELNQAGRWIDEVENRLKLPENAGKFAELTFDRSDEAIVISVKDEGPGFDWNEYLEFSAERAGHNHGRGIALARAFAFDHLEYRGNGNEVVVTVAL